MSNATRKFVLSKTLWYSVFAVFFALSLAITGQVMFSSPIVASPSNTCLTSSVQLHSRIVDESVIADILKQASFQGHIDTPPSIMWVPHTKRLIVSWGVGATAQSSETQVLATMNQDGSECHIIGRGFVPHPSPDGKYVAYISRQEQFPQIFVMNSDGSSAPVQVTNIPGGVAGSFGFEPAAFCWLPDSKSIVYATNHEVTPYSYATNSINVHVYRSDAAPPSEMFHGAELRAVNADGSGDRKLYNEFDEIHSVVCGNNPDMVFLGIYHLGRGDGKFFGAIKSFQISSAKAKTIVQIEGLQRRLNPVLAYNGTRLIYPIDPVFLKYDIVDDFRLRPLAGGKDVSLTSDFRTLDSMPQWDDIHKILYFMGEHDSAFKRIYSVRQGESPRVVSQLPEEIQDFALSPDGETVAWIGLDVRDRMPVRVMRIGSSEARAILDLHPYAGALRTSQVTEFHYTSKDGLRLPALLVKPLNYVPGHTYPLITQIHGGGWSSYISLGGTIEPTIDGPLEWQYWAAKGYAMVITDYRITGTYGRAAVLNTIKNQDFYARDCDDALGAVDYAITHKIADPARLGVFGMSYGGVHTNFMITYTRRFRAAISYEGWGDEFNHYASPTAPYSADLDIFRGSSINAPQNYFRQSSVFHMKGVTTATLFVSGDPSKNSNAENREDNVFMYAALRDQGIPTELLQYDNEGHGLTKLDDQLDLLRRATAWFDEHLMHVQNRQSRLENLVKRIG